MQAARHSGFVMWVAASQKPMQSCSDLPPPPGVLGAVSLGLEEEVAGESARFGEDPPPVANWVGNGSDIGDSAGNAGSGVGGAAGPVTGVVVGTLVASAAAPLAAAVEPLAVAAAPVLPPADVPDVPVPPGAVTGAAVGAANTAGLLAVALARPLAGAATNAVEPDAVGAVMLAPAGRPRECMLEPCEPLPRASAVMARQGSKRATAGSSCRCDLSVSMLTPFG